MGEIVSLNVKTVDVVVTVTVPISVVNPLELQRRVAVLGPVAELLSTILMVVGLKNRQLMVLTVNS